MNAQEPDQADSDQVERDDVVEQFGPDEDEDAREEGNEGSEHEMDIQEMSFVFDTASMYGASRVRDGNYPVRRDGDKFFKSLAATGDGQAYGRPLETATANCCSPQATASW